MQIGNSLKDFEQNIDLSGQINMVMDALLKSFPMDREIAIYTSERLLDYYNEVLGEKILTNEPDLMGKGSIELADLEQVLDKYGREKIVQDFQAFLLAIENRELEEKVNQIVASYSA